LSEFFRPGVVGATLLIAAVAVASPAAAQTYHSGQVCWPETPARATAARGPAERRRYGPPRQAAAPGAAEKPCRGERTASDGAGKPLAAHGLA